MKFPSESFMIRDAFNEVFFSCTFHEMRLKKESFRPFVLNNKLYFPGYEPTFILRFVLNVLEAVAMKRAQS